MRIKRAVACLAASLCLLYPAVGVAQSERGAISGRIIDSTKAGLPGVSVTITNTATGQATTVVTSDTGAYTAANLAPGPYNIATVSEQVTVIANSALLQTSDARAATNMSNELIDKLPLVVGGAMRSVFDLVGTVAEAKGTGNTASLGGGQGGGYSASLDGILITTNRGANTTENAFLTPSLEALTEFSVETNGFKPEFGQAAGGAITFASKSGTNKFQGSVYEFLRDDKLDTKGYFASGAPPVYKQHNYGTSFGGPVKLPGYDG